MTSVADRRGQPSATAENISRWRSTMMIFVCLLMTFSGSKVAVAQNRVVGELEFEGKTKVERDSGVWIDGNYVGYLKELKGSKKITLLPGEHEVAVRQSGYQDYVQKVIVEPGEKRLISVSLHVAPLSSVLRSLSGRNPGNRTA